MCKQWISGSHFSPVPVQRFAENLQIKKAKNDTVHSQHLKYQRKNGKGSLFAFLEVARTLQTAVHVLEPGDEASMG